MQPQRRRPIAVCPLSSGHSIQSIAFRKPSLYGRFPTRNPRGSDCPFRSADPRSAAGTSSASMIQWVHRRAQGIQIGRGFRPVSRVALLGRGIAGTQLALWQAAVGGVDSRAVAKAISRVARSLYPDIVGRSASAICVERLWEPFDDGVPGDVFGGHRAIDDRSLWRHDRLSPVELAQPGRVRP